MPAFRLSASTIAVLIIALLAVIAVAAVALILGKDAIVGLAVVVVGVFVLVAWIINWLC